MTKSKKPTEVGTVEVRRWFKDIDGALGGASFGPRRYGAMSYSTNGHVIAFCKSAIGITGGPVSAGWMKTMRFERRFFTADFGALRKFASTRKRKDPVKLFSICVNRALLNRLLRKAPKVKTIDVGVDGEQDAILIRSERWFAYIMPHLGAGRMPSFSRTVRK